MSNTNSKRYYSPQFSAMAAVSVRRLAWAINKPMPAAVDFIIRQLPSIVDPAKICQVCKDSTKCKACTFCFHETPQEQAVFLAAQQGAI